MYIYYTPSGGETRRNARKRLIVCRVNPARFIAQHATFLFRSRGIFEHIQSGERKRHVFNAISMRVFNCVFMHPVGRREFDDGDVDSRPQLPYESVTEPSSTECSDKQMSRTRNVITVFCLLLCTQPKPCQRRTRSRSPYDSSLLTNTCSKVYLLFRVLIRLRFRLKIRQPMS